MRFVITRFVRRYSSSFRSADETRQAYIKFFEGEGHVHVPSSSVIPPSSDESLLFTNAGMNQFKGVLAGVEPANKWPPRVVTHQKCIRAGGKHNDLDNIGKDLHHLSFFEMMGNWAFNNSYGKKKACSLAWKFLTEVIGIPKDRLYVTYFGGNKKWGVSADTETRYIWRTLGVDPSRILPFVDENFWEMGRTGSCGPCTEIHYDRKGRANVPELVNLDDSVVELWNIVFTNSMRHEDGSVTQLNATHVDTGLGLERLVSVVQGVGSNFDTDLFRPIIGAVEKISEIGSRYGGRVGIEDASGRDSAFRLVADHVRAVSVALADGAHPAAYGPGFMVRKMVRRAAWRADKHLYTEKGSLKEVVPAVVASLESAYPELRNGQAYIEQTIEEEENKFWKLVEKVPKVMQKRFKDLQAGDTIDGASLFMLHDGEGLSPDLVEQWAGERGLLLDLDGFEEHRQAAAKKSREADEKKKSAMRKDEEEMKETAVRIVGDEKKSEVEKEDEEKSAVRQEGDEKKAKAARKRAEYKKKKRMAEKEAAKRKDGDEEVTSTVSKEGEEKKTSLVSKVGEEKKTSLVSKVGEEEATSTVSKEGEEKKTSPVSKVGEEKKTAVSEEAGEKKTSLVNEDEDEVKAAMKTEGDEKKETTVRKEEEEKEKSEVRKGVDEKKESEVRKDGDEKKSKKAMKKAEFWKRVKAKKGKGDDEEREYAAIQ